MDVVGNRQLQKQRPIPSLRIRTLRWAVGDLLGRMSMPASRHGGWKDVTQQAWPLNTQPMAMESWFVPRWFGHQAAACPAPRRCSTYGGNLRKGGLNAETLKGKENPSNLHGKETESGAWGGRCCARAAGMARWQQQPALGPHFTRSIFNPRSRSRCLLPPAPQPSKAFRSGTFPRPWILPAHFTAGERGNFFITSK